MKTHYLVKIIIVLLALHKVFLTQYVLHWRERRGR